MPGPSASVTVSTAPVAANTWTSASAMRTPSASISQPPSIVATRLPSVVDVPASVTPRSSCASDSVTRMYSIMPGT